LSFLGSRTRVIENMRFSNDAAILKFVKAWDRTPECDRKQIPLELFALKAEVEIPVLVGSYVMCMRSLSAQKSALVAMTSHPKVVGATVTQALTPGGSTDRKMLHEAVGFLPTSKGLTINQNFAQNETEDESGPLDVNDMFPMINAKEEKWQGARQKLLEGAE